MTASASKQTDCNSRRSAGSTTVDAVVRHLERTCHSVIDGRRAARALTDWARQFALSEPEFQLLWCLRLLVGGGFDQTTLASRLALSPAQVSTSVERLRTQGWIAQNQVAGDRRRNLWQLTPQGLSLLAGMLAVADPLHFERLCPSTSSDATCDSQEAAA